MHKTKTEQQQRITKNNKSMEIHRPTKAHNPHAWENSQVLRGFLRGQQSQEQSNLRGNGIPKAILKREVSWIPLYEIL